MKTKPKIFLGYLLPIIYLFFISSFGFAQGLMAVSDNLLSHGTAYPVTWKGMSTFPKFQFHTFQVVSGKTGWTKSKYNSKLFSRLETINTSQNGSYVIASQAGDSAVVNFTRNFDYQGLEARGFVIEGPHGNWTIGSEQEVLDTDDNYVALIETSPTESVWRLVVTQKNGAENDADFYGWMTDGNRRIDIKAVYNYQKPGKKSMVDLMMGGDAWHKGFELFENAKSIGAVQLGPNKKQLVIWLSDEIDSFTEFLVAAATVGLLNDYMKMAE
ncbi:hypothetical protein J0A67_05510 [Algoriphagus aestuariicola]|uniref:Uncharacterized protein n=1 Tax=Algoriphagus aestuariicola TaxID=1852016 RepID=A0ABS3BLY0_9BACT|nr:hypothetical protein [Algoriphagus aestuariicola]MBN7800307.1 hypothetical protein [Algoriphagus aestuariicola]